MRALLLLALVVVGAAGEEPAALPERVRLSGGSIGYLPGRGHALPAGVEAAAKPASRKGTLEKSLFFYHRLPLIHPDTKAIGVGASLRYAAVDGLTRRDRRAWTWPVIVPAPNSFAHPTRADNRSTICVIPKTPLAPLATYWVKVRYKLDGEEREHTWRFNTGRPGPRSVLPMR